VYSKKDAEALCAIAVAAVQAKPAALRQAYDESIMALRAWDSWVNCRADADLDKAERLTQAALNKVHVPPLSNKFLEAIRDLEERRRDCCAGCRANLHLDEARREHFDPIMGAWFRCTKVSVAAAIKVAKGEA
jgi:hypothetical protein